MNDVVTTKATKDNLSGITLLGSKKTTYTYDKPCAGMLETFPAPAGVARSGRIELVFPEFTSLCPKTGQPDFATIQIMYVPNELCVETKSLKLYFFAWRGEGTFMETIVDTICSDLVEVLQPRYLEVIGEFAPRGGIKLTPTAYYSCDNPQAER